LTQPQPSQEQQIAEQMELAASGSEQEMPSQGDIASVLEKVME